MGPLDSKSEIAELVARYGSSSSTAWLEFERYFIWRPGDPIPESSFTPAQGYMIQGSYAFAWGNPLVSDPSALAPTIRQYIAWAEKNKLRPVWLCVDEDLEKILASEFGWSTVTCIYEDVIDPEHVINMTSPGHKGVEGVHAVKDLKKNLRKAQGAALDVEEMKEGEWTSKEGEVVEEGIAQMEGEKEWRSDCLDHCTALARPSPSPLLACKATRKVGVLIMTPIRGNDWQVKNAVSFPDAPKGTSEKLIYTALRDLHNEEVKRRYWDPDYRGGGHVTFGISAAKQLEATHNLSGWGVDALSKAYKSLATTASLTKRADFRGKFDTSHVPKFICYPPDGFGMDGAVSLLQVLRK